MIQWLKHLLVLASLCALLYGTRTVYISNNYGHYTQSEFYPSCVDIVDVWPPPNSVLKPFHEYPSFADYMMKVTFSRPVEIPILQMSYAFLSVSTLSPLNFYPYYARFSQGSEKVLWLYFRIANSMKYIHKVNLIIGGLWSREQRRRYNGSRIYTGYNHVKVPSTIIGEYYFKEFIQSHLWFQPPQQQRFPSPYCLQGKKRPSHVPQMAHLDDVNDFEGILGSYDALLVHSNGHLLNFGFEDSKVATTIELHVSTPLGKTRNARRFNLSLPSVVSANYAGYDVLVRLPDWKINVYVTGVQNYMYNISVNRELVYELIERIYNNQYKSVLSAQSPTYLGYDYGENLPIITTQLQNISVTEYYERKFLDYYYKIDNNTWAHVTRAADINSQPASLNITKNMTDNSHVCPANSARNVGRQGLFINSAIERHTFYHRLVPTSITKRKILPLLSASAEINVDYGNRSAKILEVKSIHDFIDIPAVTSNALSKYSCVIPALIDLPDPPVETVYKQLHYDKCIFIPNKQAASRECGGLQLFRNIDSIINSDTFCGKYPGDCIGPPLSSVTSFPTILTYGLEEMTGFEVCNTSCMEVGQKILANYVYPESAEKVLIPRSSVILTRKHGDATTVSLELIPELSREHLYLSVPQVTVLSLDLPNSCSGIIINLVDTLSWTQTRVSMSVVIDNKGEGGGEMELSLMCSGFIKVSPTSANQTKWIKPKNNSFIEFGLDTSPSFYFKKKFHKCQITMALIHPLQTWELSCSQYFPTYFGRINNPCGTYVEIPVFDMDRYIIPEATSPLLDLFLTSTGTGLRLIRGMTLSMKVSVLELQHIWIIDEVKVACVGLDIVILSEDELLLLASVDDYHNYDYVIEEKHTYSYNMDFTRNRKIFIFSSKSTDEEALGICLLEVIVNRPNGICIKTKEVVTSISIPLSSMAVDAIITQNDRLLMLMSKVYGKQTVKVMLFLGVTIVFSFLFCCVLCGSLGGRLIGRKKIPGYSILDAVLKEFAKVKKQDKSYWANPQVYITSGIKAAPHKPHFVLHRFQTSDLKPLDDNPKHASVKGELRYQTKKMPVVFGRIKKVFVDTSKMKSDVWLVASSGVYLLRYNNAAPEYKAIHHGYVQHVHNNQ